MFKRNVALGLAAILLVSGMNVPVKAETLVKDNAENQAYVLQTESEAEADEDFSYVETAETKSVDLTDESSAATEPEGETHDNSVWPTEEAAASSANPVEESTAPSAESTASSANPAEKPAVPSEEPTEASTMPSAKSTETPAAPSAAPDSSAQPAINEAVVQKPVILAENGFEYTVTVEEPVDNIITASTAMHFASLSDYYNHNFRYHISENSDMTGYSTVYGIRESSQNTDGYDFLYIFTEEYKLDTTYYIALYDYSSTDGDVQVSDIVSVTTKKEAECKVKIVPDYVGAGTMVYGLECINISDRLQDLLFRIYYSRENNFEDVSALEYFSDSMYKNEDGQFYSTVNSVNVFEPETTYYLKAFRYSNGQSKYFPVSDVAEITTVKDEIYPDDTFKDAVVFEAVKKQLGGDLSQITLSKLERVTELNLRRSNSTKNAVTSLEGIEKLLNLKNIDAGNNDIEDLTPISKLFRLESADFYNNKIKNIPDLSALGSLTSFDLKRNCIQTGELTVANTNIPEYFRNDSDWISNTAAEQRTAEDISFKVAPVYYISQGTSQFQAEIGNIRGLVKYSLSILEGEKVIADKIDTYNSYYSVMTKEFYIEDTKLTEGVHDLTFVVYADGVEVKRSTASVEYIDSVVYDPDDGYETISEGETFVYFYGYLYGSTDNITTIELYGPDGNIVASKQVSLEAYKSTDYRYGDFFSSVRLSAYRTRISLSTYFDKKLKAGKYSAKLISGDGNSINIPDFLDVTAKPLIDSLSMSSSYPNNSGKPQIYVSISGNLDFNKIYPVIKTDEGRVITEVRDLKITGTESAVYMIENTSELGLSRDMVIAIERKDASYEIYNPDYTKQVTLFNYANIYYSEHVPDTNTIKLFMENVDDGEYEWDLYTSYPYGSEKPCAKGVAPVKDGLAYVTFESTDAGSDLFDQSSYYLKAQVKMRGEIYTVSEYIYNTKNNTPSKELSLTLAELSSVLTAEGIKLSGQIYKSAFGEDSVLKAELYGDDDVKIMDITDVQKCTSTYTSNNTEYDAWDITVDIPAFEAASGRKYQLTVYADDTAIGTSDLYSVNPDKLSYNYFYVDDYQPADKTIELRIRGYFPADIDYSKLTINLSTRESNKYIGTLTVKEITNIFDFEGNKNDYVYALMDTLLLPEDIADYVNPRAYVYYNGEPVDYMYGEEYTRYATFEQSDKNAYLSSSNGGIIGVGTYDANPVTVSVYYPYATKPIVSFTLTGKADGYQFNYFMEDQFEGVTVNSYENKYYILLTDASGAYLYGRTGYITAKEDSVNSFVKRFYTKLLGRGGEAGGIKYWADELKTGRQSAILVGYMYVSGEEFVGLNLNNEDYLERLYETFMNRPSDEGGKAYWLERLDAGFTRDYVYLNFATLDEFTGICQEYGIRRGEGNEVGVLDEAGRAYANQNLKVSQYVTRCYTKVLNRPADAEGVEFWCGQIITKAMEAKAAAEAYVLSEEFVSKNKTDEEYVEVLYQTFFDRAGDEGGTDYWLGQLSAKAMTREDVLHAFSATPEFAEILAGFGM